MNPETCPSFETWLSNKLTEPSGSSAAGFHFVSYYLQDPWKFFLKYVLGLEPEHTAPPLVFGKSIHDAIECMLLYGQADHMTKTFSELMKSRKPEYADQAIYENDLARGKEMLLVWANTWYEHDLQTRELLDVEETEQVKLANGLSMTIRTDARWRDLSTDKVIIDDHKTTSWSVKGHYQGLQIDDQSSAYIWGTAKQHPDWQVLGLQPDVLYQKGSVVKAERPGLVVRTPYELKAFELKMIGVFQELNQKVRTYLEDPSYQQVPEYLFARNTKDEKFFSGSEFHEIYRQPPPAEHAPLGYRWNPKLRKQLTSYLEAFSKAEQGDQA